MPSALKILWRIFNLSFLKLGLQSCLCGADVFIKLIFMDLFGQLVLQYHSLHGLVCCVLVLYMKYTVEMNIYSV